MGEIRTDLDGRTTLPGLYAAGEAACTGVHGANRLASNSLLEGLVFGTRAAQSMLEDYIPLDVGDAPRTNPTGLSPAEEERVEAIISSVQRAMWNFAGLLRQDSTLSQGVSALRACEAQLHEFTQGGKGSRRLSEARALCVVSDAILRSALARTESRGAHFRNDYPHRDDVNFNKHSVLGRKNAADVVFETW
jgi:L-aspartate oxidase